MNVLIGLSSHDLHIKCFRRSLLAQLIACVFSHLVKLCFYCLPVVLVCMCSQRYETWRTNVAARANSLACCPKSWRSFDCRPPRWTFPTTASSTTPASLFWPTAWRQSEVSHAVCSHHGSHTERERVIEDVPFCSVIRGVLVLVLVIFGALRCFPSWLLTLRQWFSCISFF